MEKGSERYKEMLGKPHHVSKRHPQMSMEARAAQFAPFAALTGYGEAIREAEAAFEGYVSETELRYEADPE